MKIVIAPDSFKGSLRAADFCDAARDALAERFPGAELVCIPMADGGEGTCEALCRAAGGRLLPAPAADPLGRPVPGFFALLPARTAAVELAAASGLPLLAERERDPFRADSGGTGTLMRAALDALFAQEGGRPTLIVGLGGSATNDGGAGLLRALGARLLDAQGREVPPGAEGLRTLARIDPAGLDPRLRETRLLAACDVTAPLCGPDGAAAVFGPQKGAAPADVPVLDGLLARWGDLLRRDLGADVAARPGSGAAGGAGAALMALGAVPVPGFELLREFSRLDERLTGAALAVTGEGQLSAQTLLGKLPARLAALAKTHGARTVAVVGVIASDWRGADSPFDRVLPLCAGGVTPEYSMTHAAALVRRALLEREL